MKNLFFFGDENSAQIASDDGKSVQKIVGTEAFSLLRVSGANHAVLRISGTHHSENGPRETQSPFYSVL